MQARFANLLVTSARVLLGLYFILPDLTKAFDFEANSNYMAEHGMVLIPLLLVLTIH